MADGTKIEWADATWNPITGCSVVSPGCTNCYAMKLAGSRMRHHPSRAGLTQDTKAGPVWTGEVRFNEQWLDQPLRWPKGRRIFVCAHGDLFAEGVPDEWIDRVFAVMALAPQHTSFLVLTKRAERMREYIAGLGDHQWLPQRIQDAGNFIPAPNHPGDDTEPPEWPLPNVWAGVSVEDQPRADERIPHLLATPAAKRFISAEPLLGPVDLTEWLRDGIPTREQIDDPLRGMHYLRPGTPRIDLVIAGGESGPNARPMHPAWARSLRDQCAATGVPFFFKQWGEFVSVSEVEGPGEHYSFSDGATVRRVGKTRAGRLLDGRTHEEMPG